MKKYIFLLALGIYSYTFNIHGDPHCPDTTVKCEYEGWGDTPSFVGYLFDGQKVPSYWHAESLSCRPMHYDSLQLKAMCEKLYPGCKKMDHCHVTYYVW